MPKSQHRRLLCPVATARRGTIVSTKQYTGHLQPHIEVKVFANVPGKIVAMNATVGQSVAKGDVLAETNSREATLAVITCRIGIKHRAIPTHVGESKCPNAC